MKGKTLKILLSYFENEEIQGRARKIQNNLYTLNFSAEFRHSQQKRTGNFKKKKKCRSFSKYVYLMKIKIFLKKFLIFFSRKTMMK